MSHPLPAPTEICRPLLAVLRLYGGEALASRTYAPLADAFDLSDAARTQTVGDVDGPDVSKPALPAWPYRVNRAVGLARGDSRLWVAPASSTPHAVWRLTKRGEGVADTVLKRTPHFRTLDLRDWPGIDPDTGPVEPLTPNDFQEEAARRAARAAERERIGLLGERLCYDRERERLAARGHDDLAARVHLVSRQNDGAGYDLRTFDDDGDPLHVEIKTTAWPRSSDRGFWLSQNEAETAQTDDHWRLWRVWDADGDPSIEDLGNPIVHPPDGWSREASSWFVGPATAPE